MKKRIFFMAIIATLFLSINSKAESIKKKEHVTDLKKVIGVYRANMLFYAIEIDKGKEIILGAPFEFEGSPAEQCLAKSMDEEIPVIISGDLITYNDNSQGFDTATVTCTPNR